MYQDPAQTMVFVGHVRYHPNLANFYAPAALRTWLQVAEGIQSAAATKTPRRSKVSSANQSVGDESPARETLSLGSSDSEEPSEYLFDFQYIESFVTAVRDTIDWGLHSSGVRALVL